MQMSSDMLKSLGYDSNGKKVRKVVEPTKIVKARKKRVEANELVIMKNALKILKFETVYELKFHPKRLWRFDIAIPHVMIAIEYEGINVGKNGKSRHTTLKGYTEDTVKYNEAVKLGWRVLRYTSLNYQNMITDLEQLIDKTV